MTVKEMAAIIGKEAMMRVEQTLFIPVMINDARQVFQRVDVLVSPVGGDGTQWVSLERVRVK